MKKRNFYTLSYYQPCYEGEGGEQEGEQEGDEGEVKTFTEAEVNKQMAALRMEHKRDKEKTISELKNLRQRTNATEQEKQELSVKIDELENSLLTKEQKAEKEKRNQQKQFEQDLEEAKKQTQTWQNRFVSSTNERALMDAAVSTDAVNPSQIVAIYGGVTELVEDKDDEGQGLQTYTPMVEFVGIGKDKKQQKMRMPVVDAMKKIKEDGLNNNLFKNGAVPGTGASPNSGSGSGRGRQTGEAPVRENYSNEKLYMEAYKKWRKER